MKILNSAFIFLFFLSVQVKSQSSDLFNFTGKIIDENSKPVSYANLTLQELSISAVSSPDGNFSFSEINRGVYHITINRSGFINKTFEINLDSNNMNFIISLKKGLIETSTIDVTGTFIPTEISNSTFSITSISPRSVSKSRNENIASTIQNVPGINNLSTGTTIGKPIIRGLSYQSVLILHDGIKHESQLWGDEHGPEIPVFNIDRIEILRGPSSLIYGSDGIGGVVNIITKPLQFSSSDKLLKYGNIVLNGFSMNNQYSGNINLGLGSRMIGIQGYAGLRKGTDIKTPQGVLKVNTPEGENIVNGGSLFNSGDKEFQAGLNIGLKTNFGFINASYENFNRELQIHENPAEDPNATPNQKILTNNLDLKGSFPLSKSSDIEALFSYENQNRIEYESNEAKIENIESLNLNLGLFQGDLRFHHMLPGNVSGTIGISINAPNNRSTAEEKLIPNYNANAVGVYIMENLEKKYFTVSGGVRFDTKKMNILETVTETDPEGIVLNTIPSQTLNFNSFSYSLGAVYKMNKSTDIYANVGTGWRPPSEFELFVDGIHEGTGRFEKGLITQSATYDPTPESSINVDAGFRYRNNLFNADISVYRNSVNNFVFPQATGLTDSASGFPIYDITQDNSTFTGYEYNFQVQPAEWLLLTLKGDYVRTIIRPTGNSLPFTPPAKNIFEIRLQKNSIGEFFNPYFIVGSKFVSAATQTGELETYTPAYTLLNAGFGFDFVLNKSITSLDFEVTNLADTKYTDHLSRYRYYAMSAGRSFNLKLTIPFEVK